MYLVCFFGTRALKQNRAAIQIQNKNTTTKKICLFRGFKQTNKEIINSLLYRQRFIYFKKVTDFIIILFF